MVRAAGAVEREPARAGATLHHRDPDFRHRALLLATARYRLRSVSTSRAGAAGGSTRHFHRHVDVLEGERSNFPMFDLGHHPGLGLPDGIRVSAAVSRFAGMHESANADSEVAERS